MTVFHLDLSRVQLYEAKSYWKVTILVFNGNEVLTTGVSVLREGVTCWGHGTTTAKLTWHCTPSWHWALKYFHRGWDKTKGDFVPWNSKTHLSLREPWLFIATFQELNTFLLSPAETTCFLNPVTYSYIKNPVHNTLFFLLYAWNTKQFLAIEFIILSIYKTTTCYINSWMIFICKTDIKIFGICFSEVKKKRVGLE